MTALLPAPQAHPDNVRRVQIKPEFTGMTHCPRKMSGIALMRCGEYQERDRCAHGCRYAATREQIEAVARERKTAASEDLVCPGCGGEKKSAQSAFCKNCSNSVNGRRGGGRPNRVGLKLV